MTISFNGLGNEGRLGNQIFQYAFIKGLGMKCGCDWIIPPPEANRYDNYGLFDCFELTGCDKTGEGHYQTLECRDTLFHEEILNDCKDNVNYSGTYQTEKYFEHIDSELRRDLTFKKGYLEPCQEFIDSVGGRDNIIFLHVRRGNPNITGRRGEKWSYQVLQQYHPLMKKEYYLKALDLFEDTKKVIVVSDTIDWCKKQDWLQGDRFLFSDSSYEEFNDGASVPYIDLCLMSLCGGGIIANSSLSWWGAWLQNNTGKIVAPDPWYGSANSHLDTRDLIPDRWFKVYNDPTPIPAE
tara:strand:+ start:1067 stop:1951 length:885 start_codon:yes stop_codon:yes gene_type:complete